MKDFGDGAVWFAGDMAAGHGGDLKAVIVAARLAAAKQESRRADEEQEGFHDLGLTPLV